MRCWECKDEVLGVGGLGVKIGAAQLLWVKILRFEKDDFLRQYQHIIMQLLSKTCIYAGVSL